MLQAIRRTGIIQVMIQKLIRALVVSPGAGMMMGSEEIPFSFLTREDCPDQKPGSNEVIRVDTFAGITVPDDDAIGPKKECVLTHQTSVRCVSVRVRSG